MYAKYKREWTPRVDAYYFRGITLDECEVRSYVVIHYGLGFVAST